MDKERDLLPWILGGLLTAAAAMALTAASTQSEAPARYAARQSVPSSLPPATVPIEPVPESAQIPPLPASEPTLPAGQAQSGTPPPPSTNRVWECRTNGQKTFSNSPCGEKASVREIGPINGMDPTPLLQTPRSYASQTSYEPDYGDPGEQDVAENSYPALVAIPFIERRRHEHAHRPHGHDRGSPRKN